MHHRTLGKGGTAHTQGKLAPSRTERGPGREAGRRHGLSALTRRRRDLPAACECNSDPKHAEDDAVTRATPGSAFRIGPDRRGLVGSACRRFSAGHSRGGAARSPELTPSNN